MSSRFLLLLAALPLTVACSGAFDDSNSSEAANTTKKPGGPPWGPTPSLRRRLEQPIQPKGVVATATATERIDDLTSVDGYVFADRSLFVLAQSDHRVLRCAVGAGCSRSSQVVSELSPFVASDLRARDMIAISGNKIFWLDALSKDARAIVQAQLDGTGVRQRQAFSPDVIVDAWASDESALYVAAWTPGGALPGVDPDGVVRVSTLSDDEPWAPLPGLEGIQLNVGENALAVGDGYIAWWMGGSERRVQIVPTTGGDKTYGPELLPAGGIRLLPGGGIVAKNVEYPLVACSHTKNDCGTPRVVSQTIQGDFTTDGTRIYWSGENPDVPGQGAILSCATRDVTGGQCTPTVHVADAIWMNARHLRVHEGYIYGLAKYDAVSEKTGLFRAAL